MDVIKHIVEFVFGSALFINALIFVPQAIRVFKEKTAKSISILTFSGFLFIQFTIVLHGLFNRDYLLAIGYLLSMITCGLVVALALIYRRNHKISKKISIEEVFEQLPGHIYWKNKEGVCLGCNKNNSDDFKISYSEFIGKTDHDVFSRDDADKIRLADEEVMNTGKPKVFEEEITINGKRTLYLSFKSPLRSKYNEIIGVVGTSVDITASKQKTLNNLKMLENIIAIMPEHIYWMNKKGVYLGCNDNQAIVLGFKSRHEIIGKSNADIKGFFIPEVLDPVNKQVMLEGKTITTEEPAILNDGAEATFLSTKAPIRNHDHEVVGMVGISINITDRKKSEYLMLENELQKIKLEGTTNLKKISEQVTHDIRSPLASLLMVIEACKNLPESERISLRKIASSINDIANNLLSRYKNYENEKDLDVTDPQYILVPLDLSEILSEKKYQYKKHKVKFRLSVDKTDNLIFIKVDPLNFNRMLSNLINNAVEATENKNGIVSLKISTTNDEMVKIIVQDNGKGMSQNIIDKITNNIAVTSGKENGSGIGFAQIRNTVKANNGKISIDSKVGKGTKITITFPRVDNPNWIADKIIVPESTTIIILDDDPSIHEAWKARFEPYRSKVKLKHFELEKDIMKFVSNLTLQEKDKLFLLSDFELIDQKYNGLQIIKKLDLQDNSILVTSHYADKSILESATKMDIKVIPKQLASTIPIKIEGNINTKNKRSSSKSKKVDLVIVDDNQILADAFADLVRSRSLKEVDVYYNPKRFLENLSKYEKNTKICLDNHFGNNITGVELAKQLNKDGYTKLYLFSGSSFEKNKIPDYLTVITKGDVDAINKLMKS